MQAVVLNFGCVLVIYYRTLLKKLLILSAISKPVQTGTKQLKNLLDIFYYWLFLVHKHVHHLYNLDKITDNEKIIEIIICVYLQLINFIPIHISDKLHTNNINK